MRVPFLASALVLAGALAAARATRAPPSCKLTLELIDSGTGKPLPGLVRFEDGAGRAVRLEGLLSRGEGLGADSPLRRWWVVPGPVTLSLPAETLDLEAFGSLDTETARQRLELGGKAEAHLRLPIRRFYDAAQRGLASANTHLHLNQLGKAEAERYLREIPRADGLDIVFLSHLERTGDDAGYISNRFTAADLEGLSRSGVLFANGEEHRHNFGSHGEGYGHVMLLDILRLIQPVSIGPGIMKRGTDGLPLQAGIEAARRDGAATIWCHNNWGFEDVPNWLSGRLDAQNIFDGGEHGSFEHSFYRYLDLGLQVPFSTGTDWFQYDYSRVYVPAARPLKPKQWLRSLAAGKSFITNGPFLEFEVGGQGLGQVVRLPGREKVAVKGVALGRSDFKRLELVQSGKVVHRVETRPEGGHFTAELKLDLEVREPCWLALRIPPPPQPPAAGPPPATPRNELGQPLFAHTSAIQVEVAGERTFNRTTAEELLAEMEKNVEVISRLAVFADDGERRRVLDVHRAAMETLRMRLAMKGTSFKSPTPLQAEVRKRTFTYKRVGPLEIKADVHREDDDRERPVVVWIHGGALINGHREGIPQRLKVAVLQAGFVLVTIDYRLAPETQLPQIIADVEDALRWIHERGPDLFHADPARVAVAGGSAGGYLTLIAGFRARPRPVALVSFWGYGDLVGPWYSQPSPHPRHRAIEVSREQAYKQVGGKPLADARDRPGDGGAFYLYCRQTGSWPKAVSGWDPHQEPERFAPYMPLKNVTRDYPPTFLIHGEKDTDVPHEQSVLMAAELKRHGVKHRLVSVPNAEHGLEGGGEDQVDEAYRGAFAFLREYLERK